MAKIDFKKIGMTKNELIEKYGEELTKQILNSSFLVHATISLNEKKEPVFYHIDIEHALKEIRGIKSNYFD